MTRIENASTSSALTGNPRLLSWTLPTSSTIQGRLRGAAEVEIDVKTQLQFAVNQASWNPDNFVTFQLARGAATPIGAYRFANARRANSIGYSASPRVKIEYSSVAERDCVTYSTSLEEIVTCARNQIPPANSGWTEPSAAVLSAYSSLVTSVLSTSTCKDINVGATVLSGVVSFSGLFFPPFDKHLAFVCKVRVALFVESSRSYCILHEIRDANNDGFVDVGLGLLVVDLLPLRNLVHQAPHPIADGNTETQAVTLMKLTKSRVFLMAGCHRNANVAASTCQPTETLSDPAHNVQVGGGLFWSFCKKHLTVFFFFFFFFLVCRTGFMLRPLLLARFSVF
jgi:hypothetical protein